MKFPSPIYDMLHQEIRACADHLLESCRNREFSLEEDGRHIIERLGELLQFSKKIRNEQHYHPLSDFKHYLENHMLSYHDDQKRMRSMRLSEAVDLLAQPASEMAQFKPLIVRSLFISCIHHFQEAMKPGRPLQRNIREIHKI